MNNGRIFILTRDIPHEKDTPGKELSLLVKGHTITRVLKNNYYKILYRKYKRTARSYFKSLF